MYVRTSTCDIPTTQRKREMNQRIYSVVFWENFEKCNRNAFFEELVQNNLNYFDMLVLCYLGWLVVRFVIRFVNAVFFFL